MGGFGGWWGWWGLPCNCFFCLMCAGASESDVVSLSACVRFFFFAVILAVVASWMDFGFLLRLCSFVVVAAAHVGSGGPIHIGSVLVA